MCMCRDFLYGRQQQQEHAQGEVKILYAERAHETIYYLC